MYVDEEARCFMISLCVNRNAMSEKVISHKEVRLGMSHEKAMNWV